MSPFGHNPAGSNDRWWPSCLAFPRSAPIECDGRVISSGANRRVWVPKTESSGLSARRAHGMRRSKVISAWSLLAASALVLTACGGGGDAGGNGSTGDAASMAEGKAQASVTLVIADVPEMDPVTVTSDEGYSAYNHDTAGTNRSYNTYVLICVLTAAT